MIHNLTHSRKAWVVDGGHLTELSGSVLIPHPEPQRHGSHCDLVHIVPLAGLHITAAKRQLRLGLAALDRPP